MLIRRSGAVTERGAGPSGRAARLRGWGATPLGVGALGPVRLDLAAGAGRLFVDLLQATLGVAFQAALLGGGERPGQLRRVALDQRRAPLAQAFGGRWAEPGHALHGLGRGFVRGADSGGLEAHDGFVRESLHAPHFPDEVVLEPVAQGLLAHLRQLLGAALLAPGAHGAALLAERFFLALQGLDLPCEVRLLLLQPPAPAHDGLPAVAACGPSAQRGARQRERDAPGDDRDERPQHGSDACGTTGRR
ncbi:MAG: hypothetical protein BRD47_07635 [Bacteroidetes bacterium QS_8_68_28]|nr:MAG: hypothetical protein BRD47_07635 [Bacteroidetes bacterium QS_8_68_28]